jgi:hypothetical protein
MEFSIPYAALLDDVARLAEDLAVPNLPLTGPKWEEAHRKAILLYLKCPGIVNVMLNYKICVEHDLPLHPTVYYELKEARKYRIDHGLPAIDAANRLYRQSIQVARAALELSPDSALRIAAFKAELPRELLSFVYTGIRDGYTWQGSEPALLERLAAQIKESFLPDILVGAAHGSIMPALLLARYIEAPLYFVRFSMFKRYDEEPILTFSDKAWLHAFREGRALLYDEDVAGGRTLNLFSEKLRPLFSEVKTACSIRHAGSAIRPDFIAKTWWD